MKQKNLIYLFATYCFLLSCNSKTNKEKIASVQSNEVKITDDALLDSIQKQTLNYFWDYAEPNSLLARERFIPSGNYPQNDSHIVTSGGTGFGLMAIISGIERGFVPKNDAIKRLHHIVDFLEESDRFHGAWSHWINGETGKVKPFSKFDNGGDLVETSFLAQGLICVREYFKNGNEREKALAKKADILWKGIEWSWYTNKENTLYWHWSPNFDWKMNFKLSGYNECLITYVMAAASPTYPINPKVYHEGWAKNGEIKSHHKMYDLPLILKHNYAEEYGGPLFWAHYSYLGLNPKGLKDNYADYWQLNTNHTKINYQYCVNNPKQFKGYSEECWGLTASYTRMDNGDTSYHAHAPMEKDMGVISPTAALSSMPYTPKESKAAARFFYKNKNWLWGPAGFYDAFSIHHDNWTTERYLAIDQGPIVIMIENYRSGLIWDLFMGAPEIKKGLDKLGFTYEN